MPGIRFAELLDGFAFSCLGPEGSVEVFLHRERGTLHICGDPGVLDLPDGVPDDLETGPYLQLPNKYDLNLGRRLCIDFAYQYMPNDVEDVYDFFRRRGAYRRFRRCVEDRGVLDQWYAYEQEETESRLRQWCADNDVELLD